VAVERWHARPLRINVLFGSPVNLRNVNCKLLCYQNHGVFQFTLHEQSVDALFRAIATERSVLIVRPKPAAGNAKRPRELAELLTRKPR
jgi:hypothetical protein